MGSRPGEAYNAACVRVYCSGSLYHLNQEVKFLYKRNNELLYRAHLEYNRETKHSDISE